jgi:predicted phosphodiesterase
MRVAALFDIHGNLPALEVVLEEVAQAGADRIVVGGDQLPGPMARETLECLLNMARPVEWVYGNGEVAVLEAMAGRMPLKVPEPYRPAMSWTADQVRDYEPLIRAWPLTVSIDIDGLGRVLFCHATPRNEDEIFTRLTPEDLLLPVFDGIDAAVVVCGHTHMQFDRTIGRTRVVNAGSIGMPFGEPGADWLLLGPDVRLKHTSYDVNAAAERIRKTTFPWPTDFAEQYVLHPPTEKAMLETFTRASF